MIKSIEKSPEIALLRKKLSEIALISLAILLLPAVVASDMRSLFVGWLPIMDLHIALYLLIAVITVLRNRLPSWVKTFTIIGTTYILAAAGLLSFGLSSNGGAFLLLFCFATTLLMGRKSGLFAFIISIVTILIIGALISNDWIVIEVDANYYGNLFFSWLVLAIGFIPFATFMLVCSRWLSESVYRHAEENREKSIALRQSNLGLEREVARCNQINDELNAHRAHLEELVKERTASITQANEQLQSEVRERKQKEIEIKKLNAQLEKNIQKLDSLNKELEAFSYSVSHDLRAPLRAINAFCQIILGSAASKLDPDENEYFKQICIACTRMNLIIDGLLTLARVSGNENRFQDVDLSALARGITIGLKESRPDRAVEWFISDGLIAQGDESQLYLVLQNLFDNAWKFTEKRSKARIEFGRLSEDGKLIYYIKDNGAGFSQERAKDLFTPFCRLHTVEEFQGNGIGLATVQRIINRHGGKIWAEGHVNEGATFYFTLLDN